MKNLILKASLKIQNFNRILDLATSISTIIVLSLLYWTPVYSMTKSSADLVRANSKVRQVVEGSLVGFAVPEDGGALPDVVMAPDGRPDLIFLPLIIGLQDANLKLAAGKWRTFETYFGARRFKAMLVAGDAEGDFKIRALLISNNIKIKLTGLRTAPSYPKVDSNVSITDGGITLPLLNNFNSTCDAPGGASIRYSWKSGKALDKMVVVRVPWRDYPCQGPSEDPIPGSYWRRFTGNFSSQDVMGDLRNGAFVEISLKPVWPKQADIKTAYAASVNYVLHVDSLRRYDLVERVSPEILLLDHSLIESFRKKVKEKFEKQNNSIEKCQKVFLDKRPSKRRLTLDESIEMDKNLATCGVPLQSTDFSEQQFIETFIPKELRKSWAH